MNILQGKIWGTKYLQLTTIAMLALYGGVTQAALVTFTDRANWETAAGGIANLFEDFNSAPDTTPYGQLGGTKFGFFNVSTATVTADNSWRIDGLPVPFTSNIPDVNGTGFVTTLPNLNNTIFAFEAVHALGFDFGTVGASGGTSTGIVTSLGDVASYGGSAAGGFFGILYDAGETFTSLSTNGGAWRGLDNFEAFTPVPIPAALWLMGSAIIALTGIARAKRAA